MITKEKCSKLSDEELVAKTLTDQNYYYCLVERYEISLKRYIRRISDIPEMEAEDVLQDVFLSAYLNLNDFDRSLKFSSWLYRIAHNETISNFRKRRARHLDQQISLDESFDLIGSPSIESELDIKISGEQMHKVFQQMKEKYREVLVLKFFEEKSYEEISDILQKPMGTIATLVSRAKKQFKDIISVKNIKF
ncbi:MAG: RNA polymerase sigma factor [Patescibacteria group bacterium]|jgi:RNA polymerase sigma-70 factor (ECF subfamily)